MWWWTERKGRKKEGNDEKEEKKGTEMRTENEVPPQMWPSEVKSVLAPLSATGRRHEPSRVHWPASLSQQEEDDDDEEDEEGK